MRLGLQLQAGVVAALIVGALPFSGQAATTTPTAQAPQRLTGSLMVDAVRAGNRLVAVGNRGQIVYSDDQGQRWQQADAPAGPLLTAVYFVDQTHGWAVGHDARILATYDGGSTWALQFSDPKREAPLLDVWFENPQRGFAVGAYGALLGTVDGGEHWEDVSGRIDNPDNYHYNGIASVNGAGLFVVGEAGSVFRSGDQGLTWQTLASPGPGSLFGVIGTGRPGTLLTFGLRGSVFRSSDAGSTWQRVDVQSDRGPLNATLSGATALADGTLLIVGSAGTVLRSQDGGQHFSVIDRPDRLGLAAVAERDTASLVLVGQGGVHLASATGVEARQP